MYLESFKDGYKDNLPPGEWIDEPDEVVFDDEETGYFCIIKRQKEMGHLCGYVILPVGHPLHGKHYMEMNLFVHGGVTYAGTPEEVGEFQLGFDCAHGGDLVPGFLKYFTDIMEGDETYKNIAFVKEQCRQLAYEIKRHESSNL